MTKRNSRSFTKDSRRKQAVCSWASRNNDRLYVIARDIKDMVNKPSMQVSLIQIRLMADELFNIVTTQLMEKSSNAQAGKE